MAAEKRGRRRKPKKQTCPEKEDDTESNPTDLAESQILQAQIVIQRLQAKYKVFELE